MITIKIETEKSENGHAVESINLIEPKSTHIGIYKHHFSTRLEYDELIKEKVNPQCLVGIYGEPFWDEERDRVFVLCVYYNEDERMESFVLSRGQMYIMQNGKTIESIFVRG